MSKLKVIYGKGGLATRIGCGSLFIYKVEKFRRKREKKETGFLGESSFMDIFTPKESIPEKEREYYNEVELELRDDDNKFSVKLSSEDFGALLDGLLEFFNEELDEV